MDKIRRLKTKTAILLLTSIVLSIPFLANLVYVRNNDISFIAESTTLSLDTEAYFSKLFANGYHSIHGNDTKLLIQYFPLFSIIHTLSKVFSQAEAYILTLLILYVAGHLYLTRLLKPHDADDWYSLTLAASSSLLFFSSLSMFNYLKSNIIFSLPYLVLPPLLFYSSKFVRNGHGINLLLTTVFCYILFSSNITHQIIIIIIVNLYIIYQYTQNKACCVPKLQRLACLNILFALVAGYTGYNVFWSIRQYGSVAEAADVIKEGFYSQNADMLKVLLQQTDWGLFSGWKGEPYYLFSVYYKSISASMLGLLIYILVLVLLTRKTGVDNKKTVVLATCAIFTIFLMMGSGLSLYGFFYENFLPFHVFRNITKFSPVLLLCVLSIINCGGHQYKHRTLVLLVLWICLLYNLPYWSYWKYFFENRSFKDIPRDYVEARNYINNSIHAKGAVLALPAMYTTESYVWSGSKKDIQGDLFDLSQNGTVIRLSEKFLGNVTMQKTINKIFKSCDKSPRNQCIIYPELEGLIASSGISYILVTKDSVFEYDRINEIENWLERIRARKIHAWDQVELYQLNL